MRLSLWQQTVVSVVTAVDCYVATNHLRPRTTV